MNNNISQDSDRTPHTSRTAHTTDSRSSSTTMSHKDYDRLCEAQSGLWQARSELRQETNRARRMLLATVGLSLVANSVNLIGSLYRTRPDKTGNSTGIFKAPLDPNRNCPNEFVFNWPVCPSGKTDVGVIKDTIRKKLGASDDDEITLTWLPSEEDGEQEGKVQVAE